jgi:hypothetical protein
MAHYAFINSQNIVTEVIVGKDETDTYLNWEQHYAEFRPGMICRRTSYNTSGGVHRTGGTPHRKNYAGIGYTWDPIRDAFIPPKPYPSWSLNEQTCLWNPPVAMPIDDNKYYWDEATTSWVKV